MLFIVSGIIIVACIVLWFFITKHTKNARAVILAENKMLNREVTDKNEGNLDKNNISFLKVVMISGVIFLRVPAFFRSALDLGLKTWVPKMMIDI